MFVNAFQRRDPGHSNLAATTKAVARMRGSRLDGYLEVAGQNLGVYFNLGTELVLPRGVQL